MEYTLKEREAYNRDRDITCERLGITKNEYNSFRLNGQALHNIYEMSCNGEIEEDQYQSATGRLYAKLDAKAKELGLYIFYQTDPRGATIYLSKEPIADNNYNRLGSECIY